MSVTVNGNRVTQVSIRVPAAGAWSAIVDFDTKLTDAALTGAATIQVGERTFSGTFFSDLTGTYQLQSRAFVLGGAAGWGTLVPAKVYHSDSGVHAKTVIADLVAAAGETLAGTAYDASFAADYTRAAGSAGDALRTVLGAVPWHVEYDGTTQIGERTEAEIVGKYEVLEYDPRWHLSTVATDDVQAVKPGSILRGQLATPMVVRDMEIRCDAGATRLLCYCQPLGGTVTDGRLWRVLRAVVRAVLPEMPYLGRYRYRVVYANPGDHRYQLQAVSLANGLPDMLPVSVSPSTPGLAASLVLGSVVQLQFLDGDPRYPVVVGHPARDDAGWRPSELVLDASTDILLGSSATKGVARLGDAVVCGPFAGTITAASAKVRAE